MLLTAVERERESLRDTFCFLSFLNFGKFTKFYRKFRF
jgi:hypothetical protein